MDLLLSARELDYCTLSRCLRHVCLATSVSRSSVRSRTRSGNVWKCRREHSQTLPSSHRQSIHTKQMGNCTSQQEESKMSDTFSSPIAAAVQDDDVNKINRSAPEEEASSTGVLSETEEDTFEECRVPSSVVQKERPSSFDKLSDLDKLADHLKRTDWNFSVDREKDLIHTNASGENGMYRIVLDLKPADQILITYVFCPVKVPAEKRAEVAEFITRANYGVMIGNFEMDYSDGELRYKGSIEYCGSVLSDSMIDKLLGKCAYTMNQYFPGIMKVIYGNMEAAVAIHEIELNRGLPAGETPVAVAEMVQALMTTGIGSPEESVADSTASPVFVLPAGEEQ